MTHPAVLARQVTVQLGSYLALRDIDFELPEKGFLALLGPNGAGKSTLIRAMLGLVTPLSGSVELFGRPPAQLDPGSVGYIPQIKTLDRNFPALPVELVVSGLRGSWPFRIRPTERDIAIAALESVGMGGKADKNISQLSGGELQRVYLARAFARKPRILILDEPATGMDALGEADMYRLLESYRREEGATIFMITHDWEVARHHATHVLLLNRKLVGFGDPASVLTGDRLRLAYGHMGHAHPMNLPMDAGHDHVH